MSGKVLEEIATIGNVSEAPDWTNERIQGQLASRSERELHLELASPLGPGIVQNRLHRARVLVQESLIDTDAASAGPASTAPSTCFP